MINLKTLFKNHFDTKEISDDNMRKFAEVHIQRLSANNGGGAFTAMITATTTAYTNYFGSMTDEATKSAVKEGLTITLNTAVETFKKAISQKEGIIRGNFDRGSSKYQEFFPLGVTEYTTATLANIEVLMQRFADMAATYEPELGPEFKDEFIGYLNAFKDARTAQLQKIGEVSESKTDTTTKRDSVENELHKNLHSIAAMFPGDVDRCMDFFDQSFIKTETDGEEEEEEPLP